VKSTLDIEKMPTEEKQSASLKEAEMTSSDGLITVDQY